MTEMKQQEYHEDRDDTQTGGDQRTSCEFASNWRVAKYGQNAARVHLHPREKPNGNERARLFTMVHE